MTAQQQQDKLNAAQIAGDYIRRNQLGAGSPMILPDVAAADIVRVAAGQTIEVTPADRLASGSIPGTAGLRIGNGRTVPTVLTPQSTKVG